MKKSSPLLLSKMLKALINIDQLYQITHSHTLYTNLVLMNFYMFSLYYW